MLETDSTRQSFEPDLNSKTDSVTYALGILNGMQKLADQYFFIGEMRGDLVSTTPETDVNLRALANFTADVTNKYDSAYVYYNVINNCNYYLNKRDTTLYTGAQNVVINEYISIAAIRAWTYLQLGRTYEKAPFFTEPVSEISKVDQNDYPELNLSEMVDKLAPELEKYVNTYDEQYLTVPDYSKSGNSDLSMGTTNFGKNKYINPAHLFIPIHVVLGDMYLEVGQYEKAAKHYFAYINADVKNQMKNLVAANNNEEFEYPTDFQVGTGSAYVVDYIKTWSGSTPSDWEDAFNNSANPTDVLTYIPMAVNKLQGTTSSIPEAFGYNYYSTDGSSSSTPRINEIQVVPSEDYYALANSIPYYYRSVPPGTTPTTVTLKEMLCGDARMCVLRTSQIDATTKYTWITKNANATVYLYRNTTVYLHLAEALNRMGYPDAAFLILKDGISTKVENLVTTLTGQKNTYITPETAELLKTELPFLNEVNRDKYDYQNAAVSIGGVHQHGAGITIGQETGYQMKAVVGKKLDEISAKFNIQMKELTKQDTINAMEDLLCDEYALEFAFEGTRFYDLCRLAKHKNLSTPANYGGSFGDLWLSDKLKHKKAGVTTKNCFLPIK